MARSTTLLPEVLAVISSASRIGTPDDTSVLSVRVKRAIDDLRIRSPKTGDCRNDAVDRQAPVLGLVRVPQRHRRGDDADDHEVEVGDGEVGQVDDELRRRRQRLAEAGEQLGEHRDDPDQQDGGDADGDGDDASPGRSSRP